MGSLPHLPPAELRPDLEHLRAERLLRKYRELLSLRLERDEAVHQGRERFEGEQARARRTRLHYLALEFPGSLRELDLRHAVTIAARVEALRLTHEHRAPEPSWARAVDAFHHHLREALAIKRWLAHHRPRGGAVDEALVAQFQVEHPERQVHLGAEELVRHLHPQGGRLLSMVWAELERELGMRRQEVEREVYG
jgi:hypothetical protein